MSNFQLKNQNIKKILEKWKKILEKSGKSQGILSVRKSENYGKAQIFLPPLGAGIG